MSDVNYNGAQEGYALDFLDAQGPNPSLDTSLTSSQDGGSGIDGNDTEDPVARGQTSLATLDQFVPEKRREGRGRHKDGDFPSGLVPNLTPGARRIPQ